MKGVVFTKFLEMVESSFGFDTVDTIIEASDLPSGGAYTAVGTYPHTEIVSLVSNLSKETGIEVPLLLKTFGAYLFKVLNSSYPTYAEGVTHPLDFLESVEQYIHVEVRKLYPDAELPNFKCKRVSANELEMIYTSARHFEDLCEGLVRGCLEEYGHKDAEITRESLPNDSEKFVIKI